MHHPPDDMIVQLSSGSYKSIQILRKEELKSMNHTLFYKRCNASNKSI